MKLSGQKFLGENRIIKQVKDNTIALTAYSTNRSFEEWHAHENSSISLLLNGTHHEDLAGKSYLRLPGDLKFIPAGQFHRCNQYEQSIKLNLDLSADLLKDLQLTADTITERLQYTHELKFTLLKLYQELDDTANHSLASAQILLHQLLKPQAKSEKHHLKQLPIWALKLKELLNDQWNSTFDLHDLALQIGVHPVTLSKYFPLYFSETLGTYLKGIKIEKAMVMIRSTALSLTEIAYTCGFSDQAHFTRTFKAYTGFLPKHYRNL